MPGVGASRCESWQLLFVLFVCVLRPGVVGGTFFITYDEPDIFPALLRQKGDQHPCRYSRPDHSRDIAGHAILQYMIFRIIFQGNVIGYTAGHRNGTKSRSTNQRINLFLRKQVHQFHKEDTSCYRQGKSQGILLPQCR